MFEQKLYQEGIVPVCFHHANTEHRLLSLLHTHLQYYVSKDVYALAFIELSDPEAHNKVQKKNALDFRRVFLVSGTST